MRSVRPSRCSFFGCRAAQRPFSQPALRLLPLLLTGVLSFAATAQAQQNPKPTPNLLSLFPSGGKAGSTVEATITEQFQLEEARGLWFSHPGISAKQVMLPADAYFPEPRAEVNQFEISIAANTPPGVYEVRGVSRYGLTNARRFVVGTSEELIEEESNNTIEEATPFKVGAVMNGKFGADYDYYRFSAKRGETLMLSCLAWRIDSRGDAVLTVFDASGRELDQMHDTTGSDPVLDFKPPADGDYFVRVHELTYTSTGGRDMAPYRLVIHRRPWVDYVEPPVVGEQPTKVTVFGRNLGGKPSERTRHGRPLEKLEMTLSAKQLEAADPLQLNCAPSEGSIKFGMLRVKTANGQSNPFPVAVLPGAATAEVEPNEDTAAVKAAPLPLQVNARFDRPGDVDGYRFTAKKGQRVWIEVHSQRLGQPTDPSFVVQQLTEDKEQENGWRVRDLKTATDLTSPAGSFRLPFASDDPALLFEAPADGEYRVLVRDDFGASDSNASLSYRVTIREPQPGFQALTAPGLSLASNGRNNRPLRPTVCAIQPGSAEEVLVVVYRREGFEGEVQVRPKTLPPGVRCDPLVLTAQQSMGALLLRAETNAKPATQLVEVIAEAEVDGKTVQQPAANVEVIWESPRDNRTMNACRMTSPLLVSIDDSLTHLGRLETTGREFKTSRGGKVSIPLKFHRAFDKLTANLTVAAINPPDRVTARTASVAAGKEAKLELDLLQDVKPGRYTIFLRGEGDIDFEREKELFDRVTADQKRVATLAQQASRDYQKAASEKRNADNVARQAESKLIAARATQQRLEIAKRQAEQTLVQAEARAKQTPGDATNNAVQAAKKAVEQASQNLQQAVEQLKLTEQTTADAKEKQQKAIEAEKAAKEHSDLGARLKRELDQQLSRARSIARKVKVRLPVHSEVITLDVAPMPFIYVSPAERLEVAPAGSRESKFAIQRLFDFKGDVDVQLQSPVGSRLRLEKTTKIAAGKNEQPLKVVADKSLEPGEYECQWVVRTRYNNRSLEERLPLTVIVKQ